MKNNFNNDKNNTINNITILEIQEAERNRIARDLHDSSIQDLTYIVHRLELAGLYLENDPIKAGLELISIKNSVKNIIEDIRNIVFDLRPLIIDDLGLMEAFQVFFQWMKQNTDFQYSITIEKVETDKNILLNIYRIVVECVLNAVKHSQGTLITFTCLSKNNEIVLMIKDDGKGIDKNKIGNKNSNFGISMIYERVNILNGSIEFNTDENIGTEVLIRVPI